jgi:hypothetical protein
MGKGQKEQTDQLVVQHNGLVEAHYRLSTLEKKLVAIVVSMIQPADQELKSYALTVKQVQALLEVKGKDYYAQLRNLTRGILKKPLSLQFQNGDWLNCNWFSSIRYFKTEGSIRFRIDPELRPFLLDLKTQFTSYELKYALSLKSFYAIRLYEILKQYLNIGKRQFDIEKLRALLGIEIDKYPQYNDFKKRVIDPAVKEINQGSDLRISFQEKKHVRKITSLAFQIWKAWIIPKTVLDALPKEYRNDPRIISVLDKYADKGEDVLKSIIAYVVHQKPTNSFVGYLCYCLDQNHGKSFLSDTEQRTLFPEKQQKPLVPVFPGLKLRIKDKIFTVEGGNVIKTKTGYLAEGQIRKMIQDEIAIPLE